jgi:hypothetical protein
MGAVGAENRSYEMQIAQKYPEVDGVGPNARRLAYGIKRHSACRSTSSLYSYYPVLDLEWLQLPARRVASPPAANQK